MLRLVLSALQTKLVHTGLELGPEPLDVAVSRMNVGQEIVHALLMIVMRILEIILETFDDSVNHIRHLITLPFPCPSQTNGQ